jgi:hypothetical protein
MTYTAVIVAEMSEDIDEENDYNGPSHQGPDYCPGDLVIFPTTANSLLLNAPNAV